jgi:hypothetical protein
MIEDLFKAISGGEGSQPGGQAEGDPLADLLGGLLGGGTSPSGAADLAQVLGGGTPPQQGGMADISGAMLGGGGAGMGSNALLAPIVDAISNKLGLPPDVAQMIVSFVIGKLLSGQSGLGAASASPSGQPLQAGSAQPGGLDLGDLLNRLGSGQGLDAGYLQSTGMHEELAQQTGLDADTATRGLQEVFQALSGQVSQR